MRVRLDQVGGSHCAEREPELRVAAEPREAGREHADYGVEQRADLDRATDDAGVRAIAAGPKGMAEQRDGAAFEVHFVFRERSAKNWIHAEDAGIALGHDFATHSERFAIAREIEVAAGEERCIVEGGLTLHEAAKLRIR